jgi:hypothetical protein
MTMKMVMVEGEEGEEDLVDLMDSEGMMMVCEITSLQQCHCITTSCDNCLLTE